MPEGKTTLRDVVATTLAWACAPFLILGVAVLCLILAPHMLWKRRQDFSWWHDGVKL